VQLLLPLPGLLLILLLLLLALLHLRLRPHQLQVPHSVLPARGSPECPENEEVIRYSTARSGLLKLARNAFSTCGLSKPISIMF
jgi:hypothetical protein